MSWKLLKSRTMPIGIDLGTGNIKCAQLRTVEGQLEISAAASAEVPPACQEDPAQRLDFFTDGLRDLLKQDPFQGRQCLISLPSSVTWVQHIKTAKMSAQQLDKSLRWEVQGKLPFPADDAIIRHLVAGDTYTEHEQGLEVIVVAAQRSVVESHLEMARRNRLEVLAMDIQPCAIVECFGRLFRRAEDAQRVSIFIDLGEAHTQVVISHGPRMVFARNLPVGIRQLDRTVADALNIPAEEVRQVRARLSSAAETPPAAEPLYLAMGESLETLTGEITKCLRYYESVFPSNAVERAIFLGGGACDKLLCQRIAQRLNLPAQIGDPLTRVNRSPQAHLAGMDRRLPQPAWAVAVGLCLGSGRSQAA